MPIRRCPRTALTWNTFAGRSSQLLIRDRESRVRVPRPLRRTEYVIVFITRDAEKGWRACLSVAHSAMVDAWDTLTSRPDRESDRLYRLRADYATGQYKVLGMTGTSTRSPTVADSGTSFNAHQMTSAALVAFSSNGASLATLRE